MIAKRTLFLALLAAGLLSAPPAAAQKGTERYIPIGRSPGVSGKYTYMGTVRSADAGTKTVAGEGWSATVTDRTHVWLDRSKLRETNLVGSILDLKAGRLVEVKYAGREEGRRSGEAEWIKVEIPAPAPR